MTHSKIKILKLLSFAKDRHITISKAKSQGYIVDSTLSFATISSGFLPHSGSLHYY